MNNQKDLAILVGVDYYKHGQLLTLQDSLSELALLANTAHIQIAGTLTQKMDSPNPNTFIGSGKVEELKSLVEETTANLVIFDDELLPRHQRELEEILGNNTLVLDRTGLILDIFALHARTSEGYLQVKLAQYEYRLPRLTRAWTHLARQAGGSSGRTGGVGGVGLRGPGETQLEVDRREIRKNISNLKKELEKVSEHRSRYREQRRKSHIPIVALVGYTNAGKSTLLNQLAGSDVYVADQLFATLDPTTRKVSLSNGQAILLTDTVGFIQKLPTQLVAAFRATLEEISEADLLLHVVDVTHPNAIVQAKSVLQTLEEINAGNIPVITALNKIDLLKDPKTIEISLKNIPNALPISAIDNIGLGELLKAIETTLISTYNKIRVLLPYNEGNLISIFHEFGHVEAVEHTENGTLIEGRIPAEYKDKYSPFLLRRTRK